MLTLLGACKPAPTENWLIIPQASKAYNAGKGGIQIYSLNYDASKNFQGYGIKDEWITLVSNEPDSLNRLWGFENTCIATNTFDTIVHIKDTIRIYTHLAPKSDLKGFGLNLKANFSLWDTTACGDSLHSKAILINTDWSHGSGVRIFLDTLAY